MSRNARIVTAVPDPHDLAIARRIAAAVILEAQKDLHHERPYGTKNKSEAPNARADVYRWLYSKEVGWNADTRCTFLSCCELLGLNPEVTRKRVMYYAPERVRLEYPEPEEETA